MTKARNTKRPMQPDRPDRPSVLDSLRGLRSKFGRRSGSGSPTDASNNGAPGAYNDAHSATSAYRPTSSSSSSPSSRALAVVNVTDNKLIDALAPGFLDFGPSDCCAFGPSEWLRVYYVRAWPRVLSYVHWKRILQFAGDVRVSVFLTPIDPGTVSPQLEQQATAIQSGRFLRVMMKRDQSVSENNAYREVLEELHYIQNEGHPFYYITVAIGIVGDSPEDLDQWSRRLEQLLEDAGLAYSRAINEHESALHTLLPEARNELGNHRRNARLDTLKCLFPFTGEEVIQERGVHYGHDLATGMAMVLDPYEQENAHTIILGTSGGGKSFFLKDTIEQWLLSGARVNVIDVEGEYEALCQDMGGTFLDMGVDSEYHINVLEHDPIEGLRQSFEMFRGWMATGINRPLSTGELVALDKGYKRLFSRFGVTPNKPDGLAGRAPMLSDLYEELLETPGSDPSWSDAQELANALYPMAIGMEAGAFNCQTDVDTRHNPLVVFSLKRVDRNHALFAKRMRQIQQYTWTRLMGNADPGRGTGLGLGRSAGYGTGQGEFPRTVEIVDEAWYLLEREDTAKDLAERARRFRKRNGALYVATQQVSDFASSRHAHAVMSIAATHVLFKQKASDIDQLQHLFQLKDPEVRMLLQALPGEYLLMTSRFRTAMRKAVPPERHALYSTDPEDLARVRSGEPMRS